MLSKKRIMQNLESKARNKRGLGTTLLMMGLLIGFGMPMLGAGWDINSMRLYKVDMQNVVDMGLLSLRAHTNNTYNGGKDIPNQVKTTIACNINTKNLGPSVQGFAKDVCASYTSDATKTRTVNRNPDGSRHSSYFNSKNGTVPKPVYRPNMMVTKITAYQKNKSSIVSYIDFKYKPIFLGGFLQVMKGKNDVDIRTPEEVVTAKYLCQDNQGCNSAKKGIEFQQGTGKGKGGKQGSP